MNTHNKLRRRRRPNRSGIEFMTLKRLWWQMSQAERYAWFELFALDVEPMLMRCAVHRVLGVRLRSDAQLVRFLEWTFAFDDAIRLRNN